VHDADRAAVAGEPRRTELLSPSTLPADQARRWQRFPSRLPGAGRCRMRIARAETDMVVRAVAPAVMDTYESPTYSPLIKGHCEDDYDPLVR
jgi:hypothetical protein